MKTALPSKVSTEKEAKQLLKELYSNRESFHPEDDAFDIIWFNCAEPTDEEKTQLNLLMEQIYEIKDFDPCGFLLDLE